MEKGWNDSNRGLLLHPIRIVTHEKRPVSAFHESGNSINVLIGKFGGKVAMRQNVERVLNFSIEDETIETGSGVGKWQIEILSSR
jgi:hypothetical protein